MELLSGNADGAVLDYTMAYYLFNAADSDFSSLAITEGVIETSEEYYAIACRKGSDLCAEINKCLAELKADGTVTSLASQYGLEGSIVE